MKWSNANDKIAPSIVSALAEMKNPQKSASNPHFKSGFAPLDEICNDVRPVLYKHGLSVMQDATGTGATITVSTTIIHSSGQWVESEGLTIPLSKADPQGACAAVTYARRYALLAMLNIVGTDEDDDGNTASGKNDKPQPKPQKSDEERYEAAKKAIDACPSVSELVGIANRIDKSHFPDAMAKDLSSRLMAKKTDLEFMEGK